MRTVQQWLDEYGESHKNETNKTIHWICVPTLFFTIVGLFNCIKLPVQLTPTLQLNVAMILILLVTVYYFSLSRTIWIGMILFGFHLLLDRNIYLRSLVACKRNIFRAGLDRTILRA